MHDLGLTDEEAHQLQEHVQQGDREASLNLIADARDRRRAEYQAATGVDLKQIVPDVGRHISWKDIVNHAFRVLDLERSDAPGDAVDSDKPEGLFGTRGYLLVESPILDQKARMPICHEDDLRLAAGIFDDPSFVDIISTGRAELLVAYAPESMRSKGESGSPFHVLHYALMPHGSLDTYYSEDGDKHYARPHPQSLFGPFVYEGKISVRVSPELGAVLSQVRVPAPIASRADHVGTMVTSRQWSLVDGEACRATDFVPLRATVKDGKVQILPWMNPFLALACALRGLYPYALVTLECKKIIGRVTGCVTHGVDFANLWAAFKERGISENEEVVIFWTIKNYKSPYRLLAKYLPRMRVMVCPKGAMEIMSDPRSRPDLEGMDLWNAVKPIMDWKPDVMEL